MGEGTFDPDCMLVIAYGCFQCIYCNVSHMPCVNAVYGTQLDLCALLACHGPVIHAHRVLALHVCISSIMSKISVELLIISVIEAIQVIADASPSSSPL